MYSRLLSICQSRNISITKLCADVTGSSGNLSTWKKGYMRSDYLAKCCDILDVSADELLGRVPAPSYDVLGKLSADEVLLLLAYRDMSDADRASLLDIAQLYQSRNASEKVSREEYA